MYTMNEFRFLYPPRPESAIAPQQFGFYERRGWLPQWKMNGTCSVIGLGPDNGLELWNRHREPLKWVMPAETHRALRGLMAAQDSPYWTVVIGELLHNKVAGGPRDTLYLFDILVFAGEYLIGYPYEARYGLLTERIEAWMPNAVPLAGAGGGALVAAPNLWVAQNLKLSAADAFATIEPRTIREGIVLKNPKAKLRACVREGSNGGASVKCRYATKNFRY